VTRISHDAIDRREALRRAALVLGGALSASTVAGVLAGCEARPGAAGAWTPRALTAEQLELVATIAEHILPETDTPGARAVGVHRFIDVMLAESHTAPERQRFLAGLADVDARAQRACGRAFLQCAPTEQRTLLEQLDREALAATPDFFRTMKELTLVGYYTSEIGVTRELRHARVPGRFEGCVPLTEASRTWAV
jgi:glucoside 3-dehydrogenase (cytochrome c) hitch-hiker subunit